jgi:putative transcriptional regulator
VKPTNVTNRIGQLREQAGGVSQGELAKHVGVTRQTLNAIERGKYSPSLEVAFRIAQFFSVGLDDVFAYDEQPSR